MKSCHTRTLLFLVLAACAGGQAKNEAATRAPVIVPVAMNSSMSASAHSVDVAPPFDPQDASAALARAYASGDAEAMRSVARQVFAAPLPESGEEDGGSRAQDGEHWSRSPDGRRFVVVTPVGLYLGTTEGVRIEAFLPELGKIASSPVYLPAPNLVAVRRPPRMASDGCRWALEEKDQAQFWVVDFNGHEIVLNRRGRIAGASPNRTTLLLSDGSETKLTLYDVTMHSERPVTFDIVNLPGNPLSWTPAECAATCSDPGCSPGAPLPWDLRADDVAFSTDGSYVALNWNGVSRGTEQGVSVHDARTGAMVGSFLSMIKANVLFSPKGNTLGLLLSSKKAKRPYLGEDTLLLFDVDKRGLRQLTGCSFASDRVLHLGFSLDGARIAVRWDITGDARNSEVCEFDLATARFVQKIRPGDPRHDDFRFDDYERPFRIEDQDATYAFSRERAARVCSRRGYLFPKSACPESPSAP